MIKRLLFLFVLFLVACSSGVTSTPVSTRDYIPADFPDIDTPGRPVPLSTPPLDGNLNDRVSFYILLDVSQSTRSFQETRNQIAGFFFTLIRKYSGVSPKVYKFGGYRYGDKFLAPIDEYSEIQQLGVSGYGDFYADAFSEAWSLAKNETNGKRVLVMIAEGSFGDGRVQEQDKILQEVQRTILELADEDSLYFLIDSNSYEWWRNNLETLEKTCVLEATGLNLHQSIKAITMDVFGEGIQWLFPGESVSIPPTSFPRQQLSVVLLNPEGGVEVTLAGGGSEALPGGFEEKNFRQHTYNRDKLPQSLQLTSYSGMAAYWTQEINSFSIEKLDVDRKKCSSAQCIEIILRFIAPIEILEYRPQLTADNGEFLMESFSVLGERMYSVKWKWESETEPHNIKFSVVNADKIVFGPVNLVPYPLIYNVKTDKQIRFFDSGDGQSGEQYRIFEMDIWFLSQEDTIEVSGCNIQQPYPPKNVPSSYWELEGNKLRVKLLEKQICESFSVIFRSTPAFINYTCNISDDKSLNCEEEGR